jgi:hypothetical protein
MFGKTASPEGPHGRLWCLSCSSIAAAVANRPATALRTAAATKRGARRRRACAGESDQMATMFPAESVVRKDEPGPMIAVVVRFGPAPAKSAQHNRQRRRRRRRPLETGQHSTRVIHTNAGTHMAQGR